MKRKINEPVGLAKASVMIDTTLVLTEFIFSLSPGSDGIAVFTFSSFVYAKKVTITGF